MKRRVFPMLLAAMALTFFGCQEDEKDYGADFEADQTNIGIGQAVNFEDNSIGARSYEWTFEGGDPSSSTEKNPDGILYTAAGEFM